MVHEKRIEICFKVGMAVADELKQRCKPRTNVHRPLQRRRYVGLVAVPGGQYRPVARKQRAGQSSLSYRSIRGRPNCGKIGRAHV